MRRDPPGPGTLLPRERAALRFAVQPAILAEAAMNSPGQSAAELSLDGFPCGFRVTSRKGEPMCEKPPASAENPPDLDSSLQLSLTHAMLGNEAGVRVGGEIDIATAATLRAFIEIALSSRPAALGVDLTGVTFMDSSGIRVLVQTARAAAAGGTEFFLVCPLANRPVRHVLEILQMDTVMEIVGGHSERRVRAIPEKDLQ